MLDAVSKVERYRREANRCAELAKEANPAFLAEIYRKVALRYVFMAEELLRGADRDSDAIEKADRMNSSLRSDGPSCIPSMQPDRASMTVIESVYPLTPIGPGKD
jgi:hypothetical protein